MAVHIGVDRNEEGIYTCLMEEGQVLEVCTFTDISAALSYMNYLCALYPEPVIAISSDLNTFFAPVHAIREQEWDAMLSTDSLKTCQSFHEQTKEFLKAIGSASLHSYIIPGTAHVNSVPLYRRLIRAHMGTSSSLCAIATILYRMREQEATWSEMRFLYLEVGQQTKTIVVVEDGVVVNGVATGVLQDMQARESVVEQAFWEGLTQDMAGLLAIHHIEDIVVREHSSSVESIRRRETVIERLGEQYQLYQFPREDGERAVYDVAMGAAIIAGGLVGSGVMGIMAEVVERMGIRQAGNDAQLIGQRTGSASLRPLP